MDYCHRQYICEDKALSDGITSNLDEISADFAIFGFTKDERWVDFVVGEDYEAFLITKRENKI
jgi:hypothetical protein